MTDRKVIQIPIAGMKNGLQVSFTKSAEDIHVYDILVNMPGRRGANTLNVLKKATGAKDDVELLSYIDEKTGNRPWKRPEAVRMILKRHFLTEETD